MIDEDKLKDLLYELAYLILNMGVASNEDRKFINNKIEGITKEEK